MKARARMLAPMEALSLNEAATKYGIPIALLSRCVAREIIPVLSKPEKRGQPLLVADADVAKLAAHYTPGRGRRSLQKVSIA